jgi:hypothetical protein
MSRIVIVKLLYHFYKPIDLKSAVHYNKHTEQFVQLTSLDGVKVKSLQQAAGDHRLARR